MKWNGFVFFPGMLLTMLGVVVIILGAIVPEPDSGFGITLIGVGILVHILLVRQRVYESSEALDPGIPVHTCGLKKIREDRGIVYEDRLIRISGDSITFFHYSFPFFTSPREVLFQDIDHIDVKKPSIRTGKWRIAGSGDLRTWYPFDGDRPSRDRIFHATLRTWGMNIGFTVERPSEVVPLLKKKGLIVSEEVT